MKKLLLLLLLFTACADNDQTALLRPIYLTCEYMENPSVVDVPQPRLAWVNIAVKGERGQKQTAYQVRVASSEDLMNEPDLWDSEKSLLNNQTGLYIMVCHLNRGRSAGGR